MALYDFRNKITGEIIEKILPASEYDTFMKENPDLERYYGNQEAPPTLYRGAIKTDNGFKEVLQRIHERTPGSTMDV